MPKIRARVALADAAQAIWIKRILVLRVTGILDEHSAFACVDACMARRASGQHAIHHVDAQRNVIGDLFRPANPHQVTRLV